MDTLAAAVRRGDGRAIVQALAVIDDRRPAAVASATALLDALPRPEALTDTRLLGITGAPGAGKSSIIAALIHRWRDAGRTVAVLAVDPSSARHGGALLGDRLRMNLAAGDGGTFVRSLADRGTTGGLAPQVWPMACVLLAAFDQVVVETVGVGQRETDVADLADTTALVLQPGAGDRIQMLKAGIMEVPDLLVLNKSDLGDLAARTRADLAGLGASAPLMMTSATNGDGIDALADTLSERHDRRRAAAALQDSRQAATVHWVRKSLAREFGSHGIAAAGGADAIARRLRESPRGCLGHLADERQRILRNLAPQPDSGPRAGTHAPPQTGA